MKDYQIDDSEKKYTTKQKCIKKFRSFFGINSLSYVFNGHRIRSGKLNILFWKLLSSKKSYSLSYALLFALGINPNMRYLPTKETCLMRACQYSCYKVVERLIALGAEINICDKKRQTVLMYACKYQSEIVPLLVEAGAGAGAGVNLRDNHLKTALMHACEENVGMCHVEIYDEKDDGWVMLTGLDNYKFDAISRANASNLSKKI